MKFQCDKCGKCCENLNQSDLYESLNRGDGTCKFYDEQKRLCSIYSHRPIICNVDEAYEKFFKELYTKEEYYKMNHRACEKLKRSE